MTHTFLMILQQTLIFYPIVLSLYISYKVLKITDLSADGVYVLGAAAFARGLVFGPVWASFFAMGSGLVAGCILALMQRKNYVHHLIAGILMTFMLYSLNFEFMGRPNLSLLGQPTLLKMKWFSTWLPILAIVNISLLLGVSLMLSSSMGLKMRAFGYQPHLLQRFGLRAEKYRMLGLMIGSMCTAISGSLFAQIHGFADLNMGAGVALIAIGSIMLGQKFRTWTGISGYHATIDLITSFLGIFCYFSLLAVLMRFGVQPVHLKFFIGMALYLSMRFQGSLQKERV